LPKGEEMIGVPRPEKDGKAKRASRKLVEERELRRAVHRAALRKKGLRKDDELTEERKLRGAARGARATRGAMRREKVPRKDDEPLPPDRPKGKRGVLWTFTLVTETDPGTLMARVKKEAKARGADFRGGETSGSFSASGVKGVYTMKGKVVTVDITEKPWYVPWALAESELRRLLA
jgi:hypothetical protein